MVADGGITETHYSLKFATSTYYQCILNDKGYPGCSMGCIRLHMRLCACTGGAYGSGG